MKRAIKPKDRAKQKDVQVGTTWEHIATKNRINIIERAGSMVVWHNSNGERVCGPAEALVFWHKKVD